MLAPNAHSKDDVYCFSSFARDAMPSTGDANESNVNGAADRYKHTHIHTPCEGDRERTNICIS